MSRSGPAWVRHIDMYALLDLLLLPYKQRRSWDYFCLERSRTSHRSYKVYQRKSNSKALQHLGAGVPTISELSHQISENLTS